MIHHTVSFLNTLFLVYTNIRYDLSLFKVQKEFCVTFLRRGGVIFLVLSAYRTLVFIPVSILVYGQRTGRGLS